MTHEFSHHVSYSAVVCRQGNLYDEYWEWEAEGWGISGEVAYEPSTGWYFAHGRDMQTFSANARSATCREVAVESVIRSVEDIRRGLVKPLPF